MAIAVSGKEDIASYQLGHTDKQRPTLTSYHNAMFGGPGPADPARKNAGLCAEMKRQFPHQEPADGCEDAAAFTAWVLQLGTSAHPVYLADGTKNKADPMPVSCDIKMALPEWTQMDKAPADDRAEALRFNLRTAYHERGHALTCVNLQRAVVRLIEAMPDAIAPRDVANMNAGLHMLIAEFYKPAARQADVMYDRVTNHGQIQGAEAAEEPHERAPDIPAWPVPPLAFPVAADDVAA